MCIRDSTSKTASGQAEHSCGRIRASMSIPHWEETPRAVSYTHLDVYKRQRGLGEFGATAMIAGNIAGKTRTLPMAVYSEVAAGNMDSAYRYVAVIVVIAFLSVILMNWAGLRAEKKKR